MFRSRGTLKLGGFFFVFGSPYFLIVSILEYCQNQRRLNIFNHEPLVDLEYS